MLSAITLMVGLLLTVCGGAIVTCGLFGWFTSLAPVGVIVLSLGFIGLFSLFFDQPSMSWPRAVGPWLTYRHSRRLTGNRFVRIAAVRLEMFGDEAPRGADRGSK
jgi:ABC-type Co2+ transport system permease subunit